MLDGQQSMGPAHDNGAMPPAPARRDVVRAVSAVGLAVLGMVGVSTAADTKKRGDREQKGGAGGEKKRKGGKQGPVGPIGPTGPAGPAFTGVEAATVVDFEFTDNPDFSDLATPGPAVTVIIPTSGRALVTITGSLFVNTSPAYAQMSFESSGGSGNVAAHSDRALTIQTSSAPLGTMQASATYLVSGLSAGNHTFTVKYRSLGNGGNPPHSVAFERRHIIVVPLP